MMVACMSGMSLSIVLTVRLGGLGYNTTLAGNRLCSLARLRTMAKMGMGVGGGMRSVLIAIIKMGFQLRTFAQSKWSCM